MKSLFLLTLTLIILTYSQKTGGGGKGGDVSLITTTEDRTEPTAERIETPRPTSTTTEYNKPTEGVAHTYSIEPTTKPTTPSPTIPIDATIEDCKMLSYTTTTCSCGTMCSSYSREYFGICPEKCGDEILHTGEFGKEPCDLNDFFAKDMSKNFSMIVLPCDDGEFAFEDKGYKMNIGLVMIVICVYYIFVH
eukprot:925639_1